MYQNLYEKIITLEKIEPFFTDGKIFVRTIHGIKYLTDDNGIYNNIIDFFDELVELLPYVSLGYRIKKEKYNIQEYLLLLDNTISSPNFKKMIDYYGASLEMENCMDNILHSFELGYEDEAWDSLIPVYCPYYNATTYIGECGVIYFRILHSTREIVIYHEETDMPESNMPQYEESDWNSHIECGVAQKYSLTKRNIKKAFETIIQIMIDDRKNITSESDN